MNSENKQDLLKQRVDQHTAMIKERIEESLGRTATLKAIDLIAVEAIRLEIAGWESMTLFELRIAIKTKLDFKKIEEKLVKDLSDATGISREALLGQSGTAMEAINK